MPAPRSFSLLVTAVLLLSAGLSQAQTPPPAEPKPDAAAPSQAGDTAAPPATAPRATAKPGVAGSERDELKREVLEQVRRELDKTKSDIREEVSLVESEADARNYDASTIKELKQTVNLLQLHGYFRVRGNLFNKADLGRGPDPSNYTLFPVQSGTSYLGAGDTRLRLNPVLQVADFITIKSQFDVLDNVVFGGNPLTAPFFDAGSANVPAPSLSSRIAAGAIDVKRVWAEIKLPVGEIAFGRMGYHWGEGFYYNDGNCFDCDYGNTFDRLQFTTRPLLGHLFTAAVDLLSNGQVTNSNESAFLGRPIPLQQLAAAYRFSLTVQKKLAPFELKRKLDNGEWALQYGALLAYRMQGYETVATPMPFGNPFGDPRQPTTLEQLGAQFGEADVYVQAQHEKLRLASEVAMFGGQFVDRIGNNGLGQVTSLPGQNITYLSGAALFRGKQFFLKQDSLSAAIDLGFASGDKTPGMGIRTSRPGAGPNGSTVPGNIDGPKYACTATGCTNHDVTNFQVNPDFRIDELMWRNLFTQISGAYFARAEVAFKPGGRASGGADDYGIDVFGRVVYSQAIYASSTPSGTDSPLGVEIDAGLTFTTKDGFIAGAVAGFLVPLAGMNNTFYNQTASLGQVYRGFLGVQF